MVYSILTHIFITLQSELESIFPLGGIATAHLIFFMCPRHCRYWIFVAMCVSKQWYAYRVKPTSSAAPWCPWQEPRSCEVPRAFAIRVQRILGAEISILKNDWIGPHIHEEYRNSTAKIEENEIETEKTVASNETSIDIFTDLYILSFMQCDTYKSLWLCQPGFRNGAAPFLVYFECQPLQPQQRNASEVSFQVSARTFRSWLLLYPFLPLDWNHDWTQSPPWYITITSLLPFPYTFHDN